MKLVPLNSIFNIEYGNQFDLSKMKMSASENERINFISRSSKNFGIVGKVDSYNMTKPYPSGLITVTLGGSYLLASFIQPKEFYTAQNIKVLEPKSKMSFNEKLFYCACIQKNRFKYSSHGREANVTLDLLLVPDSIPKEFEKLTIEKIVKNVNKPIKKSNIKFKTKEWQSFPILGLFEIHKGKDQIGKCTDGRKPLISAIGTNNGVTSYVEGQKLFKGNSIAVVMNGVSTGESFYQVEDFYATADINILTPRFELNRYIAIFICTIIKMEKFRFSYGRKWSKTKMEKHQIKLPVKKNKPDFIFMENYIKSLPFSKSL